MAGEHIPSGTVHRLPADFRTALTTHGSALDAWRDITPLARNEWICWVQDAKKEQTRAHRIELAHTELAEGQRRPCCWPGCSHREKNGS